MMRIASAALAGVALFSACATPTTSGTKPAANAVPRQVTVLYVADLHAQLEAHPELFWRNGEERIETAGGFARVAAAIDQIRKERGGEVLVLDAGDTFQGSGVAAMTEGAAMVEPLNAIGFDAMLPGNWEVAYGEQALRNLAAGLNYPMFASNLRDTETGERLFEPWIVKEVSGVKVAVIGFTDPDVPVRQPPAYSEGLSYDDAAHLQRLIDQVHATERPDVVLLLTHLGLSRAAKMTSRLTGLDLHLSGDTHERTYEPVVAKSGVWTVEPGGFGSFLGRLDLWVKDGEVVDRRWELIELTADRFPEDPEVARRVAEAIAPHRATLEQPIGMLGSVLARYAVVENPLDNVLSDAIREAGGTEIGLSNGFRFGTPMLPGPVRHADLWNLFPVVNQLKTGEVTGRQLRAFWEQELENVFARDPEKRFGGWVPRPSGMTLRFRADAPKGQRVLEIKVNGKPLEDDRVYTITACEREGDTPDTVCRIRGVKNPRVLEVDAHEAVEQYLARHGEIRGQLEDRVIGEDLPRILRTQQVQIEDPPVAGDAQPQPQKKGKLVFVVTTGLEDIGTLSSTFRHAKAAKETGLLEEVVVLGYGRSVVAFDPTVKAVPESIREHARAAQKVGVRIVLCAQALKKYGIDPKGLAPSAEVTENAMHELARLINDGYQIIRY
jgi:S-sulfosulfanyl-L-cysteine sulfohydrolase